MQIKNVLIKKCSPFDKTDFGSISVWRFLPKLENLKRIRKNVERIQSKKKNKK